MVKKSNKSEKIVSPSTLKPNSEYAFKSMFYYEKEYSNATIKCDYDTNRNPFSISKVIKVLKTNPLKRQRFYPYEGMVFTTKKGFHLRIWYCHTEDWLLDEPRTIKLIPAHSTLRVQSLLNDDPQRQIFNKIRVRKGETCWNILWNCKIRNGVIVSKEDLHEKYTRKLMSAIKEYGIKVLQSYEQ